MIASFTRHRRSGSILGTFGGLEAEMLRALAAQIVELLRGDHVAAVEVDPFEALLDFSGPTVAPEDPVVARLLPAAYTDDDEAAADFRRFTEKALRSSKAASAASIVNALNEAGLPEKVTVEDLVIDVELDQATAMAWMRAMTDIRLALATRLGLDQHDEAYWLSLPEDDRMRYGYDIYDWVGYVQEILVEVLDG